MSTHDAATTNAGTQNASGRTREQEIIDAFIRFADRLVDDFDLLDLTIELTRDCARLLDVAAAGLLLGDAAGDLHLVAATSEHARRLEQFQVQRDEGPCLDCYHSGRPVSVPDLPAEAERWPRFAAASAEQGFVSVHAVPMRLQEHTLGALGLFGTRPGNLPDADLNLAQALVHVASIGLVQQNRSADRTDLLLSLQSTVVSRGVLELAKGVLAEEHGWSMDSAAERLRAYARAKRVRLTSIARIVVDIDDPSHRQVVADIASQSDAGSTEA